MRWPSSPNYTSRAPAGNLMTTSKSLEEPFRAKPNRMRIRAKENQEPFRPSARVREARAGRARALLGARVSPSANQIRRRGYTPPPRSASTAASAAKLSTDRRTSVRDLRIHAQLDRMQVEELLPRPSARPDDGWPRGVAPELLEDLPRQLAARNERRDLSPPAARALQNVHPEGASFILHLAQWSCLRGSARRSRVAAGSARGGLPAAGTATPPARCRCRP
jgi:hypothetical protein